MKAVPLPVWHLGWRGQVFQVQRPFQFCCLPNNSFALTDKPEEILYLLNERGQIMARRDFTGQGQLGALSCDEDNRIYMTRYEASNICIFDASGKCLRTISLSCILKKTKGNICYEWRGCACCKQWSSGSSFFEVKRSVDAAIVMSNFQIMIFIIKQYQHKIQQNY